MYLQKVVLEQSVILYCMVYYVLTIVGWCFCFGEIGIVSSFVVRDMGKFVKKRKKVEELGV